MKIYQAAQIIQQIFEQELVFIQYEDGSENKFIYRFKGQAGNNYINIKNLEPSKVAKILNKM